MVDGALQQEPGDWIAKRLEEIECIVDAFEKVEALVKSASRVLESEQKAVLERALAAAENTEDDFAKVRALGAIAPQPHHLFNKVFFIQNRYW